MAWLKVTSFRNAQAARRGASSSTPTPLRPRIAGSANMAISARPAEDRTVAAGPLRVLRVHKFPRAIFDTWFMPEDLDVVPDRGDPDVVALATGRHTPAAVQRQIVRARMLFGWRPLLVAHYGEIHADPAANLADLDQVFSFAPTTTGRNCRHERHYCAPHLAALVAAREALAPDALWARPKTRFCNFVYSNSTVGEPAVRERFVRALMARARTGGGRVDCPGKVLTNMPRLVPNTPGSHAGVRAKLDFLSNYRFTVAFENTSAEHYVTEKILHALLAGSVPIYWGCPQVAEYYNPDAFVNCHAFGSFDEVIDHVLALEADPARLAALRRAPMLRPDSRIPAAHADLRMRHRALAEEAFERRGAGVPCAERWRRWAGLLRRTLALCLVKGFRFRGTR